MDGVVAGVFQQLQDNGFWHPVAYYSKTMAPPKKNYDIHNKEILAIMNCLSNWRLELMSLANTFGVLTDYRALEYFMTKRLLNARQA